MVNQHTISAIKQTLEKFADVRLALFFGSYAKGKQRNDSDVDIAVLCNEVLSKEQRFTVEANLERIVGRDVDVVDLYGVPQPVTSEALQGIRLVGSDDVEDFIPLQRRLYRQRMQRFISS